MNDTTTTSDATQRTEHNDRDADVRVANAAASLGIRRRHPGNWFGGVCTGIADRYGVDPLIVRAGFILATTLYGIGIPIYLLAWTLLPDGEGNVPLLQALRARKPMAIVLVVVTAFIVFSGLGLWGGFPAHGEFLPFIPLLIIAGLVWYIVTNRRNATPQNPSSPTQSAPAIDSAAATPQPLSTGNSAANAGAAAGVSDASPTVAVATRTPIVIPRVPRVRRQRMHVGEVFALLGLALAAGVAAAALRWNAHHDSWGIRALMDDKAGALGMGCAVALAVLGLGLVFAGLRGRRTTGLWLLTLPLCVAAVAGAAAPHTVYYDGAVGDQNWVPTTLAHSTSYSVGAGRGVLDLRQVKLDPKSGPVTITVRGNLGEVNVLLPATLRVNGTAESTFGGIDAPGTVKQSVTGPGESATFTTGSGSPAITLDAKVAFGHLSITQ